MGVFIVTENIGQTTYYLDLLHHAALSCVHNVFHILLLCDCLSTGAHANAPPIKINGEAEQKVAKIK